LDGQEQAVAAELAFLRRHLHENLVASRSDPAPRGLSGPSRLCSPGEAEDQRRGGQEETVPPGDLTRPWMTSHVVVEKRSSAV
jgi:hypothetical protein